LDALTKGGDPESVPGVAGKNGLTPTDHSVRLDAYPCFSRMKGYIELSR
jgi:hypothetical protein